MDSRTFKFSHWHVVTFIYFIVSDDPFERPPCVALVQHQIRRTVRWLGRTRLARIFGWRERKISLDGMNCSDGLHINKGFVQVHSRGCELRNLGNRSLNRLLLLGTSTTWEVVQIHSTGYWLRFPLPSLDESYWDHWRSNSVFVPTGHSFFLIFPHCDYPCDEENQLKKKKKQQRAKWYGRHSLRRVVSSWLRFSAVGNGPSPQAARRLRVTRSWKVLPGKARTSSIRSK